MPHFNKDLILNPKSFGSAQQNFWDGATCRRHEAALHCRRTTHCLPPRFTCGQASSFVGSKTSRTMLCGRGEPLLRLEWPRAAITLDINSWVNVCRRYADMQKQQEQEQADEVSSLNPLIPPGCCMLLFSSTQISPVLRHLAGAGCNSTQAAPHGARRGRQAHAQPPGQPSTHPIAQRPALQCSQADPSALEGTASGASRD